MSTKAANPVAAKLKPKAQHQRHPGNQARMHPAPIDEDPRYRGVGKLAGKVALISGGDSGIGRAVALAFAKEGAEVAILHLPAEEKDAAATCDRIDQIGQRCLKLAGDIGKPAFCKRAVARVLRELGQLDILVNNAAEHTPVESFADLTPAQLQHTFQTNLFGFYHLTQASLPHLRRGSAIINTASTNAYRPRPTLIDYANTKAAILNFTRSLASELVEKGIRVNAVAPGPVWTPLVVSSFPPNKVKEFGTDNPMKRPAQPAELAPSYVFLASEIDSSFVTGQTLHVNGGSLMVS
jgi:NAD(P)-dependent dehydrogenase (short-subunit alcohol dehydrogenase family)